MTEATLRLGVFFTVLATMMALEACFPARRSKLKRRVRWLGNFSLLVISSVLARLLIPLSVSAVAFYSAENKLGLFNTELVNTDLFNNIKLPEDLAVIISISISVILLDMIIYWQHRLFHTVPMLWRLHKVHHADSHIDTSTGLRFHPIEIVLSVLIKMLAVVLLGIPVVAVIIFEVLLNAFALFNHANIRLPQRLEKFLQHIIITQRLHRIHHSQVSNETNSNYGFSVSWWDKIFGTFILKARKNDQIIIVGLKEYPADKQNSSISSLLKMPFDKR